MNVSKTCFWLVLLCVTISAQTRWDFTFAFGEKLIDDAVLDSVATDSFVVLQRKKMITRSIDDLLSMKKSLDNAKLAGMLIGGTLGGLVMYNTVSDEEEQNNPFEIRKLYTVLGVVGGGAVGGLVGSNASVPDIRYMTTWTKDRKREYLHSLLE